MLAVLADMLFTATGQRHPRDHHERDSGDHWAGRFDGRERLNATRPPHRFNRYRDPW